MQEREDENTSGGGAVAPFLSLSLSPKNSRRARAGRRRRASTWYKSPRASAAIFGDAETKSNNVAK